MYLSRVFLDVQNRETMRLLSSPEFVHGAVERCFAGEKQRRLWRIDSVNNVCSLLVVSSQIPDFSQIAAQYGPQGLTPAWQSKSYEKFLERLQAGQTWRFRLKANPVRSVMEENETRGKVMAHVTVQQQKDWLMKRAQSNGFLLDQDRFDVTHTQWNRFHKAGGRQVTLKTATYEGALTILDAAAVREALTGGIGRAKAYGCGLMTLAPG